MDDAISIRPATDADLTVIVELFRAYAASLGVDLAYQDFEAELASLPGAYAPPAGALLLAVSSHGNPLGCVAVRSRIANTKCEMKRLYTVPQARGTGIGRALALAAIKAAASVGYESICLDTLPTMVAAQGLYRDLGFDVTSPYYDSPIAGTIFMTRTLGGSTPSS